MFLNDISDEQIINWDGPTLAAVVSNVDARTYGFEVNASYDVSDNWSISGAAAFTQTEVLDVPGELAALRPDLVRGNWLPNVPRWTLSTSVNYSTPVSDIIADGLLSDAVLFSNVHYNYIGERFPDPENNISLDPVHLLAARVGINWRNAEAYVFGENLLNEEYEVTNQFFGPNATTGRPVYAASYARGAVVGIGLRLSL